MSPSLPPGPPMTLGIFTSAVSAAAVILYQLHDGLNREFSGNQDGQLVFVR